MRLPSLFLFSLMLILASCSKDNSLMKDSATETLSSAQELEFRLPNGAGLQKINDNQTDGRLHRGVGVPIPLFSSEQVFVSTGSWVTLRFGYGEILVEDGECPEELTQADIDFILGDTEQFLQNNQFDILFNGEAIDIQPYFRTEGIVTFFDAEEGDCRYQIPWRYYVNPQSPGDYMFTFIFNGEEYSRIITWVPGNGGNGGN